MPNQSIPMKEVTAPIAIEGRSKRDSTFARN
jgi:hypothetical protein